jgi:hypothetical protein
VLQQEVSNAVALIHFPAAVFALSAGSVTAWVSIPRRQLQDPFFGQIASETATLLISYAQVFDVTARIR